MTISPILFPILLVILLKDKSSSIDNFTTNKSIHQSTCFHHCPDWWRKPSKRTEKITPQSPINSMPTMPLPKIQLPWRPLLVKKPSLKKIIPIFNSWRDSKKNSSHKDSMNPEDYMTHWTWLGNFFQSIHKKACPKSPLTSLKNITRRDWMRMKKMRKINEILIVQIY